MAEQLTFSGPLFKCFGSKWMSARSYPPPDGGQIVEPFAGSAGYSLRYAHLVERVLVREQGHLAELWRWLINEATEADVRAIPLDTPPGTDIRRLGLTLGQALLLKNWQRTNNVGDCWTISPWGNKPGQWTASTRARVAEEIALLKGKWGMTDTPWQVAGGTFFIDPPYQYNYKYRCEPPDYVGLGVQVLGLDADLVIACEAVCQKTGAVPNYLPFESSHRQVTSRRKTNNHHHSNELVFTQRKQS